MERGGGDPTCKLRAHPEAGGALIGSGMSMVVVLKKKVQLVGFGAWGVRVEDLRFEV